MKVEHKISITILFFGLIGIFTVVYFKKGGFKLNTPKSNSQKEQIILPSSKNQNSYKIPIVKEYLEDVKEAVKSGSGIVPLKDYELNKNEKVAQEILLKNKTLLEDGMINGKPTHRDIMRIEPVNISDLNEKESRICKKDSCYKALIYNFYTNSTTQAIVDITKKRVLSLTKYSNFQPDISLRLKRIAEAIVLNSKKIANELGHSPKKYEMSMANVRTALQGGSPCEDSNHLCVAPTFAKHKEERALWAIVDLTDLRLVAAKWAGLGKTTTPSCISQRALENRYIMENFCKKDTTLNRDGWSIKYRLTSSDGLEIKDVKFNGVDVIKSAKVVDWHVAYRGLGDINVSEAVYVEGRRVEFVKENNNSYMFGYNDAMGCPMFSTSVVLAFNGPEVSDIKNKDGKSIGFAINQDFRNPKWPMACNYRYENRFEFYKDGSFRVVAINKGRGCANKAIYRPVMRIDLAGSDEVFSILDGKGWREWKKEQSYHSTSKEKRYKNRFLYKISSKNNTYYIEPNRGEFKDGSRGDHERVYVSLFKEEEGARDLMTLGSCCNLSKDGPERFLTPAEDIYKKDIVLWYVPRIKNDDRSGSEYCWADTEIGEDGNLKIKIWPCIVGPKFVPKNIVENSL